MSVDILDQPRGGILETVALYLYKNGGNYPLNSLIKKMTGSDEGKEYFLRNVLGILEATDFIQVEREEVSLKDCFILRKWPEKIKSFEICFKIELLSKIMKSKNPRIRYFGDLLRKLFDLNDFDETDLEKTLREARRERGIPVSEGEELRGKIEFCIAFLRYFNMIQQIYFKYQMYVPREFLRAIFFISLEDINKPNIKLYSELLKHIDTNYLPVLNVAENRVLNAVYRTLNNEEFIHLFNFANVPDGGRTILLANKEFNAIIR